MHHRRTDSSEASAPPLECAEGEGTERRLGQLREVVAGDGIVPVGSQVGRRTNQLPQVLDVATRKLLKDPVGQVGSRHTRSEQIMSPASLAEAVAPNVVPVQLPKDISNTVLEVALVSHRADPRAFEPLGQRQ